MVLNTGSTDAAHGHCFVEGDDVHDRRIAEYYYLPHAAFPQNIENIPLSGAATLTTTGPISVACEADTNSDSVILQGYTLSIQKVGTLH